MKVIFSICTFILLFTGHSFAQHFPDLNNDSTLFKKNSNINSVLLKGDSSYRNVFIDTLMYSSFWDTVPQPSFWKKLMHLSEDSGFINVASTRQILDKCSVSYYSLLNDSQKNNYRDSLRKAFGLSDSTRIFYTTGKRFFYSFKKAIPNIDQSIPVFIKNNVDPWYAQSILLIESPIPQGSI